MRLAGVQILRLVAAVAVLVQHAYIVPTLARETPLPSEFTAIQFGVIGVYLFFAISGYVIGLQAGGVPSRFALHRIARIYPPYLAAIAIGGAVAVAFGFTPVWDASLSLLPAGTIQHWVHVPYWTLTFEMFFYAVAFALMCLRCYDIGLIVWAAIIFAAAIFDPAPNVPTTSAAELLTSPLSLIFILGAALARFEAGHRLPLALISIVALTFIYYDAPYRMRTCSAAALLFVVLIVCANWFEPYLRGRTARALSIAGDGRMDFYLIHFAILTVTTWLFIEVPLATSIALGFCIALVGGLAFGWAEHAAYRRWFRPAADRLHRPRLPRSTHAISSADRRP